jgi:hypothetical protein
MKILDLLKGRKIKVMTDALVEVELEISHITTQKHSVELTAGTKENDWWPETKDWTTYQVHFTNGFIKGYFNLDDIQLMD